MTEVVIPDPDPASTHGATRAYREAWWRAYGSEVVENEPASGAVPTYDTEQNRYVPTDLVELRDTDWRQMRSLLDPAKWDAVSSEFRIRRVGYTVEVILSLVRVDATQGRLAFGTGSIWQPLQGWRPHGPTNGFIETGVIVSGPTYPAQFSITTGVWQVYAMQTGPSGNWVAGNITRAHFTYTTSDSWPITLPGTSV